MRVLLAACSVKACELLQRLEMEWKRVQPDLTIISIVKCSSLPELSERKSLTECVGEWFHKVEAIVFLCAAGIAVRSIAPYLVHKSADPAVLVMDETGNFCVSLLSGHAGGANALAIQIGQMTGAVPVITTATDREHKFAVDDFARNNMLVVTDWELAKKFSVRILSGEKMGVFSELPVEGNLPKELYYCENPAQADLVISWRVSRACQSGQVLQLTPKRIVAGIGCRKGEAKEKIAAALENCLYEEDIRPEALYLAASIDLKRQEEGILACCRQRKIPFVTYSAEELRRIPGIYTDSGFVEQTTGVANVCERSAVAAAGGELIAVKRVYDGVTVALAARKGGVVF